MKVWPILKQERKKVFLLVRIWGSVSLHRHTYIHPSIHLIAAVELDAAPAQNTYTQRFTTLKRKYPI